MKKPLDPEVIEAANRLRDEAGSSFSAQQYDDVFKVLDALRELAPDEAWEDDA